MGVVVLELTEVMKYTQFGALNTETSINYTGIGAFIPWVGGTPYVPGSQRVVTHTVRIEVDSITPRLYTSPSGSGGAITGLWLAYGGANLGTDPTAPRPVWTTYETFVDATTGATYNLTHTTQSIILGDYLGLYDFAAQVQASARWSGISLTTPSHEVTSCTVLGEAFIFAPVSSSGPSGLVSSSGVGIVSESHAVNVTCGQVHQWRPSMSFNVVVKATDADGIALNKDVILFVGDVIDPYDVSTADLTPYLFYDTTPVNRTLSIPGKTVQCNYNLGASSGSITDVVRNRCDKVYAVIRNEEWGSPAAANVYDEIFTNQGHLPYVLATEDTGMREREIAKLVFADSNVPSPSWTASGTGATAVGNVLTALEDLGTFVTPVAPVIKGPPFRYLGFDYTSDARTTAVVVVKDADQVGISQEKEYRVRIEAGSGTAYVDLCDPDRWGLLSRADMALLEPSVPTSGGSRFGGIGRLSEISLRFSEAEVKITDIGFRVRYSATIRQFFGTPIDSGLTGSFTQGFYGQVDHRDAFRSPSGVTVGQQLDAMTNSQNCSLIDVDYTVPSWVKTVPANNSRNLSIASLGWYAPDGTINPFRDMDLGASVKVTQTSRGAIRTFYGMESLTGWTPDAHFEYLFGNRVRATAFPASVVDVRVETDDYPGFVYDYATDVNGVGTVAVPTRLVYDFTSTPDQVDHYVPEHEEPRTVAQYALGGTGNVFHINVAGSIAVVGGLHMCATAIGVMYAVRATEEELIMYRFNFAGMDDEISVYETSGELGPVAQVGALPNGEVGVVYEEDDEIKIIYNSAWAEEGYWSEPMTITEGTNPAYAIDTRINTEFVAIYVTDRWVLWRKLEGEDVFTEVGDIVETNTDDSCAGLEVSPDGLGLLSFIYNDEDEIKKLVSSNQGFSWEEV